MYLITTAIGYLLGLTIILLILLLVFIQSILGNQKLFDPIIKFLCRLFPAVFGIRVKTSGLEKLSPQKPYIFMANHINIFDGFILYGYIPNFFRGVELEDHFSWPVWGTITRRLGNIPISHSNPKAALESLNNAGDVISNGTSIAIMPEGHRSRDGKLQPFMRGPFRLAKNTQVDIIPIVMKGLWNRKTVQSKIVHPGPVDFIVGDPIKAESYENHSDRILKDIVRNAISNMLN
jgi:1-acyl-sn-glycerol-3-phosphate acyltransferase